MTYVDKDKEQKHFHYEHRTRKLNDKHYDTFKAKKFHKVRKYSTHKKLLKSIGRVGMCLNEKTVECINVNDLDNVCFILCNSYEDKHKEDLGVGPLNDAQMIAVNFHRRGFKVFYQYNPTQESFLNCIPFFIKNTSKSLVIFYSGRGSSSGDHTSIQFNEGSVSPDQLGEILNSNANDKAKYVLITDTCTGGSAWALGPATNNSDVHPDVISLFVNKSNISSDKLAKRTHGTFTYYFCKLLNESPDISPKFLDERMSPPLKRFDEVMVRKETNSDLDEQPLFVSDLS